MVIETSLSAEDNPLTIYKMRSSSRNVVLKSEDNLKQYETLVFESIFSIDEECVMWKV